MAWLWSPHCSDFPFMYYWKLTLVNCSFADVLTKSATGNEFYLAYRFCL
jgi:hypothetical protein